MKTKVALCQLNSLSGEPNKNLLLMESTVKKYSKKGVKLCIFPEDFLYGIIRGRDKVKTAGKKFRFWVKTFSVLARKYKIDIIPGSFPLYENNKLYKTTVYISSQGRVVNRYSKNNLWLSERKEYCPSPHSLNTFQGVLGKTALIICWDLMEHNLFEKVVKQGAEWIIVISFWSTNQDNDLVEERGKPKQYLRNIDSSFLIDALVKVRVYEYGLGVIFCNYAKTHRYQNEIGSNDIATSAGHSQIFSPMQQIYKKINSKKEEVLICDVSDIKQQIKDQEILYGRREDVLRDYLL